MILNVILEKINSSNNFGDNETNGIQKENEDGDIDIFQQYDEKNNQFPLINTIQYDANTYQQHQQQNQQQSQGIYQQNPEQNLQQKQGGDNFQYKIEQVIENSEESSLTPNFSYFEQQYNLQEMSQEIQNFNQNIHHSIQNQNQNENLKQIENQNQSGSQDFNIDTDLSEQDEEEELTDENNYDHNSTSNNNNKNTNTKKNAYITSIQDLVQFQNKKKNIIKKKIKKSHKQKKSTQVNNNSIKQLDIQTFGVGPKNIFRENLKPSTSHLPTLFMNILIPYLLDIYLNQRYLKCRHKKFNKRAKKLKNKFQEEGKCECDFCVEYQVIMKFKRGHQNSNIEDLKYLWGYQRIRLLSREFLLSQAYYKIVGRTAYRSQVTVISFLLSLPLFYNGVQQHQQFYKLI